MSKTELTIKQERFCEEYVNTLNVTQAYLIAYPDCKYKSANSKAFHILRLPKIQKRIKELFEERKKKFEIDEKHIIGLLKRVITTDPSEIFTEDYKVKSLADIPEEVRKLITKIKTDKEGNIQIEFADKVEAITKLGQHIGMFGSGMQGRDNRFLVRIYVVPPINYQIQLPDKRLVAKELIENKINYNGVSNGKQ